jgi:hypothetical protein
MIEFSVSMPEDRVIPDDDVLAKIMAGQPAEFDNCTIVDDLNLGWPASTSVGARRLRLISYFILLFSLLIVVLTKNNIFIL